MTTIRTLVSLSLGTALLAPLAALASGGNHPAHAWDQRVQPPPSTLTRAEVQRQLEAHNPNVPGPDGWVQRGFASIYVGTPGPGKTRAEVQRELAAHDPSVPGPDGWVQRGQASVYVGTRGPGKTRADVKRELAEHKPDAVGHDGFRMVGDGLEFVGLPDAPADARMAGTPDAAATVPQSSVR